MNKSIIDFSVPNELFRMVLRPRWVYQSHEHWGLGHRSCYVAPPELERFLVCFYAKVLATHVAPFHWHLASGFAVQQPNNKPGIDGERLVVAMCPVGRSFFFSFFTKSRWTRRFTGMQMGKLRRRCRLANLGMIVILWAPTSSLTGSSDVSRVVAAKKLC